MLCNKQHRHYPQFLDLAPAQNNQAGGRHKCAGCAYVDGLLDALNNQPTKTDLSHLPESQAGAVRHKDAMQAYLEGYTYGIYLTN
ncbi:hypothetical protein [Helicobacter sp. T3_23-1059]